VSMWGMMTHTIPFLTSPLRVYMNFWNFPEYATALRTSPDPAASAFTPAAIGDRRFGKSILEQSLMAMDLCGR